MGSPVLPYYGDQFLGIAPPTPMTGIFENRVVGSSLFAVPQLRMPCPDINDGSYFLIDNNVITVNGSTGIRRYNKSNTLVWTFNSINLYNANSAVVAVSLCWSPIDNRYYMPFSVYDTSYYAGLAYLSAPFTAANFTNKVGVVQSIAGSASNPNSLVNASASLLPNGTVSYIFGGLETTFVTSTGTPTRTQLTQNGISVPSGMIYRSVDGTIFCSGPYRQGYTKVFIDVMRNGMFAKIPVNWIELSSLAGEYQQALITPWSDYVLIAEFSKQFAAGITKINRASFDNWLAANCNAMGI